MTVGMLAEKPLMLSTFEDVGLALTNVELSRSLDFERYERGNVLEGVVMMLDGTEHRDRRRVENSLFRRENLIRNERDVFPAVIRDTLVHLPDSGEADLVSLGALLAVVLSAQTAGIDFNVESIEERSDLVSFVRLFARGISIDAAVAGPDEIRRDVAKGLDEFTIRFLDASRRRRERSLQRGAAQESEVDLLTLLLSKTEELAIDQAQIVRECAFFLEAGAHTSSQSLANSLHFIFRWLEGGGQRDTLVGDLGLIQRFVHEALRLRPTNPRIRRRALQRTTIGNHIVEAGALIDLDTATANRDPAAYGADADQFNPWRKVDPTIPRYGHSFGGGIHACIGRNLAIGFPVRFDGPLGPDHLYGIVPLMVEALLQRKVRPNPSAEPVPDSTTHRWTRWASYPVLLG